jgi:hypothetical protein
VRNNTYKINKYFKFVYENIGCIHITKLISKKLTTFLVDCYLTMLLVLGDMSNYFISEQ